MKEMMIRGHRLEAFDKYMAQQIDEYLDASGLAWNLVNNLTIGVEMISAVKRTGYEGRTYRQDVFGETQEDFEATRQKLHDMALLILIGPGDLPITFVADERGIACQSCVFGNHCLDSDIEGEREIVQKYFKNADIGSTITLDELRSGLGLRKY